jgi:hypothetical protein
MTEWLLLLQSPPNISYCEAHIACGVLNRKGIAASADEIHEAFKIGVNFEALFQARFDNCYL